MKTVRILAVLSISLLTTGCVALAASKEIADTSCKSGYDNRASSICADWAAVDAAREAIAETRVATRYSSYSAWAAVVGIAFGIAGLFFNWRTLLLTNPPHIRVTNVRIRRQDGLPDLDSAFANVTAIEGTVFVINGGADTAEIGTRRPIGFGRYKWRGDGWATQCVAFWTNDPLPMVRPFEDGQQPHNDLTQKRFRSGKFAPWSFSTLSEPGKNLYVMGFVNYWGSAGNRRQTMFCRKYCPTERRFIPISNNLDYEAEV